MEGCSEEPRVSKETSFDSWGAYHHSLGWGKKSGSCILRVVWSHRWSAFSMFKSSLFGTDCYCVPKSQKKNHDKIVLSKKCLCDIWHPWKNIKMSVIKVKQNEDPDVIFHGLFKNLIHSQFQSEVMDFHFQPYYRRYKHVKWQMDIDPKKFSSWNFIRRFFFSNKHHGICCPYKDLNKLGNLCWNLNKYLWIY